MDAKVPKYPYLYREKNRGWTFRRRVPKELVPILGKGEFSERLPTRHFAEARRLCDIALATANLAIESAWRRYAPTGGQGNKASSALPAPTHEQLKAIVLHWFYERECKSELEDQRIRSTGNPEEVSRQIQFDLGELSDEDADSYVVKLAGEALAQYGFSMPSGPLQVSAQKLIKAGLLEEGRRSLHRLNGNSAPPASDARFADVIAFGSPPVLPTPTLAVAPLPPLEAEALLTAWASERQLAPSTVRKYMLCFKQLARTLGFDDIRRVSVSDVRSYKKVTSPQ